MPIPPFSNWSFVKFEQGFLVWRAYFSHFGAQNTSCWSVDGGGSAWCPQNDNFKNRQDRKHKKMSRAPSRWCGGGTLATGLWHCECALWTGSHGLATHTVILVTLWIPQKGVDGWHLRHNTSVIYHIFARTKFAGVIVTRLPWYHTSPLSCNIPSCLQCSTILL